MPTLPTLGLLSITDGRLMRDISEVYEVVSFFMGRDAYTHELHRYGQQAAPLIRKQWPALDSDGSGLWQDRRDAALSALGERVDVPPGWEGLLADGKGPIATLVEAVSNRN